MKNKGTEMLKTKQSLPWDTQPAMVGLGFNAGSYQEYKSRISQDMAWTVYHTGSWYVQVASGGWWSAFEMFLESTVKFPWYVINSRCWIFELDIL